LALILHISSISVIHFFFSSRRRHTSSKRDWSSDVCSSDLRLHHRGADHPHHRHRRRALLRRSGVGLAGHGGAVRLRGEVRQGLRSEERRVGKEWREQSAGCDDEEKEQKELVTHILLTTAKN